MILILSKKCEEFIMYDCDDVILNGCICLAMYFDNSSSGDPIVRYIYIYIYIYTYIYIYIINF